MRNLLCLLGLTVSLAGAPADFTVHEWGTFTSVVGSDGQMLPGLEVEEEAVPLFVRGLAGFLPAAKGMPRPVVGCTVKMETPVIYFYADQPLTVRVDVGFRGGPITQWYPERSGGEKLPALPIAPGTLPAALPPIHLGPNYSGFAHWQVEVLARDNPLPISAPRALETAQWPRARVAAANRVRNSAGEVEGFIFYRGLGGFALPLQVAAPEGVPLLRNTGSQRIPFAFRYEKRAAGEAGMVGWSGSLAAGEKVAAGVCDPSGSVASAQFLAETLPHELVRAGLTREEARAMLATWQESYFDRPGLRIFWIVPRQFTDEILPLSISPRPAKLERVLVGRTEVLTPAFEAELVRDFAADGGKRWLGHRYFRAYCERVRQLGGRVDVAPAAPAS